MRSIGSVFVLGGKWNARRKYIEELSREEEQEEEEEEEEETDKTMEVGGDGHLKWK